MRPHSVHSDFGALYIIYLLTYLLIYPLHKIIPQLFLSSGTCLRRYCSRCTRFHQTWPFLSALLRGRQSKIHRSQVGLHSSEPGLPWMTNPQSPVVRWACCVRLESSIMILPGVSMVEMSKGEMATADSVWCDRNGCRVQEGISSLVTDSDQCMFRIRLRHQLSSASIVLDKVTVTAISCMLNSLSGH